MPQGAPIFSSTSNSGGGDCEDAAAASGCGFFRRFCFGREEDESLGYLLRENERGVPQEEAWFVVKLRKVRELSELVAGPKWKNLIRKIGRICNSKRQNKAAEHFQYSPESYALNFAAADDQDDAGLLHSFSTRFAPGYFVNDRQRL